MTSKQDTAPGSKPAVQPTGAEPKTTSGADAGDNSTSATPGASRRPGRKSIGAGAQDGHGHGHGPVAGKALALLAVTALGVVYGDIGTSPLYALRECFSGHYAIEATHDNVLGVLSLIFWALIIVITLKYVTFILRADNHGEGGILALTALATPLRRIAMSRQRWLVLLGVFGAALLYGDGVITPAISVLSAVEGLNIVTPFFRPYVLPITVVIIIALFMIQRRGTALIGGLFGPIMVVWFAVLAILGIMHIVQAPEVWVAISPYYGANFFIQNGWHGFLVLGTVFLVVTGGEALYADMGHFGPKPIRLAWYFYVLPALLLNYFGQGSLLLRNPEAAENSFYMMAPSWALLPLVVLATAATIIASQALISGAFSLTMQAENLGFLPRLQIDHTSETAFGQIYIPIVNWALMFACIAVVLGFQTSSNLAAAYGIAVTSTMVITTIIFAVVARNRWRWSAPWVATVVAFFLVIDLAFFGANIVKIPQGGWFPIVAALLVFGVMTTWKRGSWLVVMRERNLELTLPRLLERVEMEKPVRAAGDAVFLSANREGAPAALLANLKYNHILHERVLLLNVQYEEVPYIDREQRIEVEHLGHQIYRATFRYGFMEEANVPRTLQRVTLPGKKFEPEEVPFFVNRTKVTPSDQPGMVPWREHLYTLMRRNAASAADFFCLPPARVFEIGTTIEM
jgi:KUP system potassium uptake protein